ncbi:MAG TPA: signal peptide peptidase SppA [Thermoguttaceae bacterium]|nr:signal peptide peptidase SppA [Thermoguttaceae bacterium]
MSSTPPNLPFSEPPVRAEVVEPVRTSPPPAAPRRRLGCLMAVMAMVGMGFFGLVVVIVLLGMGSLGSEHRVREEYVSHNRFGSDKVVIITLDGPIFTGDGFVKRQIDRAKEDKSVKAVVLRVDSPGGTVSGSDYLYHYLCELAKDRDIPIVVSMGGIAASGGYYVSMAVGPTPDTIFAEPTTWTGSIGVKIPHYDLSTLLSRVGVKEDTIASHELKTMGSIAKPMSEVERKIFQSLVDDSFSRFKQIIRDGRPRFAQDPKALDTLATGQVYTADQALKNGLVDKIGFVEDAVGRAIELAALDKSRVRVVKYKPEVSLATLFGGAARAKPSALTTLLEATSPRAYYLHTWLPAALASGK